MITPYRIAYLLVLLGLGVVLLAKKGRKERGLTPGKTIAVDSLSIGSAKYGLSGRPDRLLREGKFIIPEEWKSSTRIYHGHRLQLAAYLLLIEEGFGKSPPHGYIVLGDGTRVRVENTEALRSEVLQIARKIRAQREIFGEIPVEQPPSKCRACRHRARCGRSRA